MLNAERLRLNAWFEPLELETNSVMQHTARRSTKSTENAKDSKKVLNAVQMRNAECATRNARCQMRQAESREDCSQIQALALSLKRSALSVF